MRVSCWWHPKSAESPSRTVIPPLAHERLVLGCTATNTAEDSKIPFAVYDDAGGTSIVVDDANNEIDLAPGVYELRWSVHANYTTATECMQTVLWDTTGNTNGGEVRKNWNGSMDRGATQIGRGGNLEGFAFVVTPTANTYEFRTDACPSMTYPSTSVIGSTSSFFAIRRID